MAGVDRVVAKRGDWPDFEGQDGKREAAYIQGEDGALKVLRCGGCGGWSAPAPGHRVDDEGAVSPSVVHDPCGWHVWLRLDGWRPRRKSV